MTSREFHFSGSVQGVGFRWTVKTIAESIGVTGWVRNNPDGSVDMFARGDEADLKDLLEQINARFGANIAETTSREATPPGPLYGFEIIRHFH